MPKTDPGFLLVEVEAVVEVDALGIHAVVLHRLREPALWGTCEFPQHVTVAIVEVEELGGHEGLHADHHLHDLRTDADRQGVDHATS